MSHGKVKRARCPCASHVRRIGTINLRGALDVLSGLEASLVDLVLSVSLRGVYVGLRYGDRRFGVMATPEQRQQ
jgi:hypothetical protein